MSLLDFDKNRGHAAADSCRPSLQDGYLVPFNVDFYKIDSRD